MRVDHKRSLVQSSLKVTFFVLKKYSRTQLQLHPIHLLKSIYLLKCTLVLNFKYNVFFIRSIHTIKSVQWRTLCATYYREDDRIVVSKVLEWFFFCNYFITFQVSVGNRYFLLTDYWADLNYMDRFKFCHSGRNENIKICILWTLRRMMEFIC